ncbi:MAG: substrate-binding domain-containing protein [Actinobacteria bacterium]|nr:substrate-binding domain-containing protein [Actinomycetota bacterium]
MRKFFTIIIVIIAAVAMIAVFSLSGCKTAATTETTTAAETTVTETTAAAVETTAAETTSGARAKVIVYVTPCISAFYGWNIAHQAFLESVKKYGYIGSVVGDNNVDPVTMVEYFQQGVSAGADAMVVYPVEPAAFEGPYKEAAAKKIPIIEVAIDSNASEVISWVGTDSNNAGKTAAQKAAEGTGGKANILIVWTGPGNKNQEAWIAGFKEELKNNPEMKIITEVFDKSSTDVGVEQIGNALSANPEIDFIWCVEGFAPTAAATVVKEKGLVGKVKILAIDKSQETIDNIKNGIIWATLDQGFPMWGTVPVEQLINYWEGKPVERRVDSGLVFYDINNIE